MKASDWIWTRIGFGVIAIAAGIMWFLIFYPLMVLINPDVSGSTVVKVFIGVFLIVSLFNEKLIGSAGLGAIFGLMGMISGFIGLGGAPIELDWPKYSKELCICFVAGAVSVVAAIIWAALL